MSSAPSSLQSPAPSALWRSFSPSHSSGNPQPWSNPALPLMVKEAGEKPTAMLIGPALNLWPLTSNRHLKVLPGNLTTFPSSCAVKLAQKITVSYLLLSLPTSNIASTFTSSGSRVCGHVIKVREAEGRERPPSTWAHTLCLPSCGWLLLALRWMGEGEAAPVSLPLLLPLLGRLANLLPGHMALTLPLFLQDLLSVRFPLPL